MADLSGLQASETIKIVGADSSGLEQTPVQSTGAGELAVTDGIRVSGIYGALTVGTTAVELKVGAAPLSNRKVLMVQNLSNKDIYWGYNSSVTASNGLIIPRGTERVFSVSDALHIWVIGTDTNLDCRIAEAL